MSREDLIEIEGQVEDSNKGVIKVALPDGRKVLATVSGKLRMHKIRIVVGDNVTVAVSPYDLGRGVIRHRSK